MTREHMLRFTRRYKDTTQGKLAILKSFCFKFIGLHMCQNFENRAWFDKVIAKIKWCSFYDTQCSATVGRHAMSLRDYKRISNSRASSIYAEWIFL